MSGNPDNTPDRRYTHTFAPFSDLRAALVFLTRLPVGGPHRAIGSCAWAFPLAGLFVGGVAVAVFYTSIWLGFGPLLASVLCFIATATLTGALHEDGLADAVDGLFGGRDKARVLEIMRDSRLGAFGGLALVLITGAKVAALAQLFGYGAQDLVALGLVLSHMVARATLPCVMAVLPLADQSGVAASVGRPAPFVAALCLVIAIGAGVLIVGPISLLIITGLVSLSVIALSRLVYNRVGGYNGDTLGLIEQMAELMVLLGLIITAHFYSHAIGGLYVF